MTETVISLSAEEALARLSEGNRKYAETGLNSGDVSGEARHKTVSEGQHPNAVIVACSDSRVIPETIFQAGIGDIFVIRVAGNVIDKHQLGSIEYALDHLGCKLVVVLGHDSCGAVDAALHHDTDGHIKYITDEIKKAIGSERDYEEACRLNALHSVKVIEENMDIQKLEKAAGVRVKAAMYHLETGIVEWIGG